MEDEPPGGLPARAGETAAGVMLDTHKELMKAGEKRLLQDAPKVTRFVLKRIPDGPGFLYGAAQLATSPDKLRTGIGMAGSVGGGAIGAAIGGPVSAVVGSAAGDELATAAYDHRDEIGRALEATKQWMAQRNADVFGR